MPVVPCPNCKAELDVDDADVGHLVECQACRARFPAIVPGFAQTLPSPPAPQEKRAEQREARDQPNPDPDALVVKCLECGGDVSVLTADLGHLVQCPLCRQTFRARDPNRSRSSGSSWRRSSLWSRRDDEDDAEWENSPRAVVDRAERKLVTPGGWLQVLGWIDVAAGFLGVVIGGLFLAGGMNRLQGPEWAMVWWNAGPGVSGIVIGGVKAFGGAAMKQARNRTLSVLAAVVACVPLNVGCCLSFLMLPLYCVSLAFGIVGLTVLFRADVKKAFEINRPGGDVDAG